MSKKKPKEHEEPHKEVHKEEIEEQTPEEEGACSESEESRIEELEAKIKELEDQRLRDLAEFENIKKRLEKEKQQAIAYAHEQFARDMLAVIDSLDNALSSIDGAESSEEALTRIKEGIELTLDQFKKVFAKHGIELIEMDEGFNPHLHEAVMQVESDEHESGEIVQVLQKGYKIKERVLRPAMVSVAK